MVVRIVEVAVKPVLVVLGSREPHERRSRAAAAVRYLARHPETDVVVFSGYNGEAEEMLALARTLGLPTGVRVLLEQESQHTYDNAVKTRELLHQHDLDDRVPVVLSCPYHRPRARRTFLTAFRRVDTAVEGKWSLDQARKFVRDELPRIVRHGLRGHVDLGPLSVVLNIVRRCA